jgi:hypothetical protein
MAGVAGSRDQGRFFARWVGPRAGKHPPI